MIVSQDKFGRELRDLRISVTDRCNFRCTYCMPKEVFGAGYQYAQRSALLSYEEITRISRIFVQLGVKKIRLTGGEPLLRRDLEVLIAELVKLDDELDLSMTTNASLLTEKRANQLHTAGLHRLNVSLDALDDKTFMAINDVGYGVQQVLDGIDNAANAGFDDIKVNMVVKRGVNEHSILPMAEYFKNKGHTLRFIEYMDVGNSNGWQMQQVVPAKELVDMIDQRFPIRPASANYVGEVAQRWSYQDGSGEVGVIASVTQPFCQDCSRLRLSAVGELYTCLFASKGTDMRTALRSTDSDQDITAQLQNLWRQREDRYSEQRTISMVPRPKVEMSHIGG